jgi:hypothetical protein
MTYSPHWNSFARLAFVLLGLDSNNASEFLNSHLVQDCSQHRLTFTSSRPYWKNDQARRASSRRTGP